MSSREVGPLPPGASEFWLWRDERGWRVMGVFPHGRYALAARVRREELRATLRPLMDPRRFYRTLFVDRTFIDDSTEAPALRAPPHEWFSIWLADEEQGIPDLPPPGVMPLVLTPARRGDIT